MFGRSMLRRHSVRLSPVLFERAEKAAEAAGYSSLDEFAAHVIEKELARLNAGSPAADTSEIEKQLRGLGYIE